MFCTILLLLVGAGLTSWAARICYNDDTEPPHNIAPRDIPYYRPSWWRRWRGAIAAIAMGGTITLFLCGVLWFGNYHNEHWVTCHIDRVENLGGDKYRVQTGCGTLDNTNTPWRMKFNSPTLLGWLKEGATVEMRVAGANFPAWGWYPNIIAIK